MSFKNICIVLTAMLIALKIIGVADIGWLTTLFPIILWAVLNVFFDGLSVMLRSAIEKRKTKKAN